MSASYRTKNGWTSKKGAFLNGVWHCDCETRLPVDKFQTKNGGKNHGRWFYTCQKGKPKDCKFFLWTDDAKLREESAVLRNSRSEPTPAGPQTPQTPQKKETTVHQQPTPDTRDKRHDRSSQVNIDFDLDKSFEWSSSNDDELVEVAKHTPVKLPAPPRPIFETPSKPARTATLPSPGKRTHSETFNNNDLTTPTRDDIFVITTSKKSKSSGLLFPIPTPAPDTSEVSCAGSPPSSSLAQEALSIVQMNPTPLLPSVEAQLVELLNKHDLRTQGIVRGRDISRVAVQSKEKRITELRSRIAGLEVEKETQRLVIDHLNQDAAMSPRKPRGGFTGGEKSQMRERGR